MGGPIRKKDTPRDSSFVRITKSLYLSLSPTAYHFPLEGACAEHISPHLLTYWAPLDGVLISYDNPRLSERPNNQEDVDEEGEVLGLSIAEYAVSYVWLTCDFLVLRPQKGDILEGEVNLQSESVLGLLCYNFFNASIDRSNLPANWSWDGERWLEGKGKRKDMGLQAKYKFKVEYFEAVGQESISIMGTMIF